MSAEHDPFAEFEDAAADQGERPDDSAERDEAGDLRWLMSSKVGGPLDTTPAKGIGVGTAYVDFVNRTTNFPG